MSLVTDEKNSRSPSTKVMLLDKEQCVRFHGSKYQDTNREYEDVRFALAVRNRQVIEMKGGVEKERDNKLQRS